ncbi:hypothetical protein LCGC14_2095810 [marine sediment metagenome]|uniref:Uncharacterized protein n=1 Tax=marine sediment metagenome TaxID=412755 RepID=A0A0F9H835_9ZZZZ
MTKGPEINHVLVGWALNLALEGPFCRSPVDEMVAGEGSVRQGLLNSIDGRHYDLLGGD